MRNINLKKILALTAMSVFVALGTNAVVNGQGRGNDRKQEQKAAQQRIKEERKQAEADRRRQVEWTNRNTRISTDYNRRNRNYNPGTVVVSSNRYRVYRNGSYYNTDQRGADLLRQAVNEGYRQGFIAGRNDRNNRRNYSWSNSTVYRNGSIGYQNYVNRSQYQYYFQQGFQRGYQDGSNRQYQDGYDGNYQYGYNSNGTMSVIGAILEQVLNISAY